MLHNHFSLVWLHLTHFFSLAISGVLWVGFFGGFFLPTLFSINRGRAVGNISTCSSAPILQHKTGFVSLSGLLQKTSTELLYPKRQTQNILLHLCKTLFCFLPSNISKLSTIWLDFVAVISLSDAVFFLPVITFIAPSLSGSNSSEATAQSYFQLNFTNPPSHPFVS